MIPIQQLPKSPTRKCFEEAFLELYAQKPLDQISVMALTEKAGYSRATFYRNYYSISNVLESVEEEKYLHINLPSHYFVLRRYYA